MESGKQGGSESSSEENDGIDQQVKDIDMSSTKRSYECSFCKRGFTNAQALGGHMNIHRKDRVKAPKLQHTTGPSFSNKSDEDNIPASSFISVPVPCDPSNYNSPAFEAQKNSQILYFQPSASGSRHPQAATFRQSDLSDSRSGQSWSMNQELLSANLSLRIGPMHADQEDRRKRGVNKADEVDLELRLGHDPY